LPFASACESGITAKTLGLTIPETLPATGDEVIHAKSGESVQDRYGSRTAVPIT
jgi:hypothetical protein